MQKIAVISSETAAGYKDFVNQLEQNSFQYQFNVDLYPIAVQGVQLESQLISAIDAIHESQVIYNCIVIVRGGGSRLDLSWFDTYPIAEKIANAHLPVFTGIGHEIDYSVADMVAHTNLKTPTAVADFLIEHNLFFESSLIEMTTKISISAQDALSRSQLSLEKILLNIGAYSKQKIEFAEIALNSLDQSIITTSLAILERELNDLESKSLLIKSLEPINVLKRGYGIVYKEESSIHSEKMIKKGEQFDVQLIDGRIRSERVDP